MAICMAICISGAHGQMAKHAVLLSGDVSYQHSTDHTSLSNTSERGPSADIALGTAVKQNLFLGVRLGYSNLIMVSNVSFPPPSRVKQDHYTAGLFGRRYYEITPDFYFFGELGFNYNAGEEVTSYSADSARKRSPKWAFDVSLTPGVAYQLTGKLYVNLTLPVALMTYGVSKSSDDTGGGSIRTFDFKSFLNGASVDGIAIGFDFIL